MRRREFMTILGGAAVFGPRIARAQGAMPVVGLLSGTNREPRLIDAIWKGLNEVGYTERQTANMEYRFAEGHFERLPALAAELVHDRAKVIVAIQSVAAPMAAKALNSGRSGRFLDRRRSGQARSRVQPCPAGRQRDRRHLSGQHAVGQTA